MQIEAGRKRFTIDEYYRMAGIGILRDGERTELIDGEVIEMSPMGVRHSSIVKRVSTLLNLLFQGKAIVSVQLPVRLNTYNEPQPDIALLKPRRDFYESRHPGVQDVFMLLEVSDTSLQYDHDVKVEVYAPARIPEVWVLDLKSEALLVHREPSKGSYKTVFECRRPDSAVMLAFPDVPIVVADLLGNTPE